MRESQLLAPVPTPPWRTIALLVTGFSLGYALIALFPHWHFETAYDLAIFDQAVWHLSRFEAPASTISGFANILGDHFYPAIGLFTPLYWIAPAPETLLVAQGILFAASIVPVFLYFRDRGLPPGVVVTLSIGYGLFWGLQRAQAADVHEIAFTPLAIATLILAMDRRAWSLFWIAAIALMSIKEDLIGFVAFAGVYVFLLGERLQGMAVTVVACTVFTLVTRIVIPSFSATNHYVYADAYKEFVAQPWLLPATLVTPIVKLQTLFMWFAAFCLLPLRSPLLFLVVPFALSRFLSNNHTHWGTSFHYSAPLAPILAMAAGDALARIGAQIADPDRRRITLNSFAGATLLLASLLPGHLPMWRLFTPAHYQQPSHQAAGRKALATIPDDAAVIAQVTIAPHLSQRRQIYLLKPDAPSDEADAEFLIASRHLSPWPSSHEAIQQVVAARRARGDAVLFDESGWIVLRRATNTIGYGNVLPPPQGIEFGVR